MKFKSVLKYLGDKYAVKLDMQQLNIIIDSCIDDLNEIEAFKCWEYTSKYTVEEDMTLSIRPLRKLRGVVTIRVFTDIFNFSSYHVEYKEVPTTVDPPREYYRGLLTDKVVYEVKATEYVDFTEDSDVFMLGFPPDLIIYKAIKDDAKYTKTYNLFKEKFNNFNERHWSNYLRLDREKLLRKEN